MISEGEWMMFDDKRWAIALHKFDPFGQYQISLEPGEKLAVLGESKNGWYKGFKESDDKREGIFPTAYVKWLDTVANSAEAAELDLYEEFDNGSNPRYSCFFTHILWLNSLIVTAPPRGRRPFLQYLISTVYQVSPHLASLRSVMKTEAVHPFRAKTPRSSTGRTGR